MMEDEEATTDMEDNVTDTATPPQTPKKIQKESAKTPRTPRFAPVSPPSTKRTTRSANHLEDDETPLNGKQRLANCARILD